MAQQYEPQLAQDPQRTAWVAVFATITPSPCARRKNTRRPCAVFDSVVKQFAGRPEATEAVLRVGQCLKEEGHVKIEQSEKLRVSGKKDQVATATKLREEGQKYLRDAVQYLEAQAEQLKAKMPPADARRHAVRDRLELPRVGRAGSGVRRAALIEEAIKKRGPLATKLPPPVVPIAKVPVQPAEQKARTAYLCSSTILPMRPGHRRPL